MGRVTNKTELAVFLLTVVKEMEVGTVDMWDTSLTVEDRLTALRLDKRLQLPLLVLHYSGTLRGASWFMMFTRGFRERIWRLTFLH